VDVLAARRRGLDHLYRDRADERIAGLGLETKGPAGQPRLPLTLDQPPPAGAFWSLTMYDVPEFYLVENPINRYSIGDRTPGLVRGANGSVTIMIAKDKPADPDQQANWLPAPAGLFRPIFRIYIPGPEILNGTYPYPAILPIA
jgi:hypothetical protein